jgi:hypothetical protein
VQACAAAYAQQPLDPSVHFSIMLPLHVLWPWEQLFVQLAAHAAEGAMPPQFAVGAWHVIVDAT